MKQLIAAFVLLAAPVAAQDVYGTWQTETSNEGAYLHVQIGPCGGDPDFTCGQIVQVFGSDDTSVVGRAIIRDMQQKGPGRWHKGTIWAPDDDRTYRSNMQLTGNGLKVEGCVAVFCRGQIWRRVN